MGAAVLHVGRSPRRRPGAALVPTLQVYLAQWKGTAVAAKLLLGEAASMANAGLAAETVLSDSKPVLASLLQVKGACFARSWVLVVCVRTRVRAHVCGCRGQPTRPAAKQQPQHQDDWGPESLDFNLI